MSDTLNKLDTPDEIPQADQIKPDPEFMKALMRAYTYGQAAHSDDYRRFGNIPRSTLWGGLIRDRDQFYPPERLARRDRETQQTRLFWTMLADQILSESQERVADNPSKLEALRALAGKAISNVQMTSTPSSRDNHFYFDINTAQPECTSAEITEQVKSMVANIRHSVGKEAESLLGDGAFMTQLQRTIEVARNIQAEVVLKEEVERLQALCDAVEDPKEAILYYSMLDEVVAKLGIEGVKVVPLSMKDAVLRGAAALYRPATGKEQAKAMIPMSQVGTDQLLELSDALDLLAHELAHHLMMGGPKAVDLKGQPIHGLGHTVVTQSVRSAIDELSFSVQPDKGNETGVKIIIKGAGETVEGSNFVYLNQNRHAPLSTEIKALVKAELEAQLPAIFEKKTGAGVDIKSKQFKDALALILSSPFFWMKVGWKFVTK